MIRQFLEDVAQSFLAMRDTAYADGKGLLFDLVLGALVVIVVGAAVTAAVA